MSSWIVTKEHITALVDLATVPGRGLHFYHENKMHSFESYVTKYDNGTEISYWDWLGQMLWDENVRGVGERYPDSGITDLPGSIGAEHIIPYKHVFTISDPRTMPTPIEGIVVARCYRYQSCDSGDVWDKSLARAFVDALIEELITQLPGYDAAPWGWTEENAHAQRKVSLMDMLRDK